MARLIGLMRECVAFGAAVARCSGRRGLAAVLLVGLGAILEGIGILLLVPLLGILFREQTVGAPSRLSDWIDWLTPGFSPLGRLALIFGLFAVLMTLRAVTLWQRDFVLGKLQMMFVEEQRVKVARRLANAEWRTLAGIGHERITHLLGGDIQRCGAGVYFLLQSGTATVMLVGQAVLAFVLSPLLAFVAIGALTLGTLAMSGLLQRSRDIGRMVTEASLALTNGMGRFLTGIKVAMSQNLQHVFVAKFEHDIGEGMRRQALFVSQQAMLRGLWSLLGVGIAGTTMLVGFGLLHLSAPVLLALLIVLSRVSGPASQLHLGFQQIAYSLPAWQAVTEMERELAAAAAPPAEEQENAPRLRGSIVFDDVAYRHHGRIGGGIQGVTLRIDEGEMVGLSGASGAGKTTLADLLVSLIEPQFGRIIVGGELLTPGIAPRWRRQIAYVAQDAVMFNDSLRQNLIWSTPGASDADIARALAVAGADTWTEALPQGLGTIVGEGGALISGGERQRLALARALLRAPSLLVLDEATSAIDIESEAGILARLRALEPLVTILMIAHRSESLRFCDRVFVLAEGALLKDQPTRARGAARLGTRT